MSRTFDSLTMYLVLNLMNNRVELNNSATA